MGLLVLNKISFKLRLIIKGTKMKKDLAQNIALIIVIIAGLATVWFGFDAFFGLVGSLYTFLDEHIWAFFAWIIAFFTAIFIVGLMIKIAIVVFALSVWFLGAIGLAIASAFK